MIPELWDYLTTSTNKEARKQGYLYHSIALAHRARRCKRHWLGHLQYCHDFLNAWLPERQSGARVAVLGSGLTLETPPEILAKHFDKIDLVDVVHTKDVRNLIHDFGVRTNEIHKFRFIEMDLNQKQLEGDYDFVISANVLSQLGYVLSQTALRRGSKPDDVKILNHKLQSQHLEQIQSLSKNHILFSDFELKVVGLSGEVAERSETVEPILKINWEKTWNWNLAPAPELSKEYSVELTVGITTKI